MKFEGFVFDSSIILVLANIEDSRIVSYIQWGYLPFQFVKHHDRLQGSGVFVFSLSDDTWRKT
jgi:hypothetical protein